MIVLGIYGLIVVHGICYTICQKIQSLPINNPSVAINFVYIQRTLPHIDGSLGIPGNRTGKVMIEWVFFCSIGFVWHIRLLALASISGRPCRPSWLSLICQREPSEIIQIRSVQLQGVMLFHFSNLNGWISDPISQKEEESCRKRENGTIESDFPPEALLHVIKI